MVTKDNYWWYLTIEGPAGYGEIMSSIVDISGSMGSEFNEMGSKLRMRAFFRSSQELGYWIERTDSAISPWPEVRIIDSGKIENQQWSTAWRDAFPPLPVGINLVVMAPWHREKDPRGRIPVYIYPGGAFGTGYHGSTQSALVLMEKYIKEGVSVADIGTGSGILAIAAVKMGAAVVYARDNDPAVGQEVKHNLGINDVEKSLVVFEVGDLAYNFGKKVDLLVANIVIDPLRRILPELESVLLPGGKAIMSGMITGEKARFHSVLSETPFRIADEVVIDDWWAVLLERSGQSS